MVDSPQPRRARKSYSICVLPLPSFLPNVQTFQRSNLPTRFVLSRLALSHSFAALCPKSVEQLLFHQSLPHSFLKMPGCMGFATQNSQAILPVSRIKNLTTEDHHECT